MSGTRPYRLAPKPLSSRDAGQSSRSLVQLLHLSFDKAVALVVGGALALVLRWLIAWYFRRRLGEQNWRRHIDFSDVQACILSTEHLQELGRVEKRTLFVKPLTKIFRNEYILSKVLEAAEQAAVSGNPMLMTRLSVEDKWHVLNSCTNHLSACFAPYHLFFNEARRVASHYRSAWYVFTITCHQTSAGGRWFITPFKPVGVDDIGMLRIRIVLMNEEELREIASGAVEPPAEFFNARHESRWGICQSFADFFQRQLQNVTGTTSGEWGRNLCGTIKRKRDPSNQHLPTMRKMPVPDYEPEDNAILRIHIPIPSRETNEERRSEDAVSKDVVLFE